METTISLVGQRTAQTTKSQAKMAVGTVNTTKNAPHLCIALHFGFAEDTELEQALRTRKQELRDQNLLTLPAPRQRPRAEQQAGSNQPNRGGFWDWNHFLGQVVL